MIYPSAGYALQMSTSSAPAVLFDIDGTLIDSNYLHVHAWVRAFYECDIAADAWRIHHAIGMDGSALQRRAPPSEPGSAPSGKREDKLEVTLRNHRFGQLLQVGAPRRLCGCSSRFNRPQNGQLTSYVNTCAGPL